MRAGKGIREAKGAGEDPGAKEVGMVVSSTVHPALKGAAQGQEQQG